MCESLKLLNSSGKKPKNIVYTFYIKLVSLIWLSWSVEKKNCMTQHSVINCISKIDTEYLECANKIYIGIIDITLSKKVDLLLKPQETDVLALAYPILGNKVNSLCLSVYMYVCMYVWYGVLILCCSCWKYCLF